MRVARLLTMLLAILTLGLLCAPGAAAEPPLRLPTYLTDNAGALDAAGKAEVQAAIDRLYNEKRTPPSITEMPSGYGLPEVTEMRSMFSFGMKYECCLALCRVYARTSQALARRSL